VDNNLTALMIPGIISRTLE